MTLNIISDLHCGLRDGKVVWNDEDYYTKRKLNQLKHKVIEFLNEKINFFEKNKDKFDCSYDIILQNCRNILNFCKKPNIDKSSQYIKLAYDTESLLYSNTKLESYTIGYDLFIFLERMYNSFYPEKLEPADYLIVAGDLGLDQTYQKVYDDLKKRTEGKFKDIFYIKGNHDYWWFPEGKQKYSNEPEDINFDHRYVEYIDGDYLILGCTLWAPVRKRNIYNVQQMNDYRYIPGLDKLRVPQSTDRITQIYNEESNWLRNKVNSNKDKKIIIFTHHMPREELVEGKYSKSTTNDAYCVMDQSCKDIKPIVWISGHSHSFYDTKIDGVRYIRNPIGYRQLYGFVKFSEVPPDHWYNTVIEV